jgi:hypothetical protein
LSVEGSPGERLGEPSAVLAEGSRPGYRGEVRADLLHERAKLRRRFVPRNMQSLGGERGEHGERRVEAAADRARLAPGSRYTGLSVTEPSDTVAASSAAAWSRRSAPSTQGRIRTETEA